MVTKKIIRNTLIKDCRLSVRAHNVLYTQSEAFGVPWDTSDVSPLKLSDLRKISIVELKALPLCGSKTAAEIITLANRSGVKFKKE